MAEEGSLRTSEAEEDDDDDDDDPSVQIVSKGSASLKAPPAPVKGPPVASLATAVSVSTPKVNGVWNPISIQAVYTDYYMDQHQVVIVLLPGGVGKGNSSGIDLKLQGTDILQVSIPWPTWIVQEKFLRHLRSSMEASLKAAWDMLAITDRDRAEHLKDAFGENFILMAHAIKKKMRELHSPFGDNTDKLYATALIGLDIDVQGPITSNDWSFFGDTEGVRMIFVDLKAPIEVDDQKPEATVKDVDLASMN